MTLKDEHEPQPDERRRTEQPSPPPTQIDVRMGVGEIKDQGSAAALAVNQIGRADIRSDGPTTIHHAEQVIIVTADDLDRFQRSLKWILVAGLGKADLLPDYAEVYYASLAVGRSIADHGFGLLVGGWSGVDYVVAESFAAELRRLDKPLSENLLQDVPQGVMPQFRGGQVVQAGQGWLDSVDIMRKADAVVLIGGAGGTYATYEYALQERKPVFPLASTGGDAQSVFQEMLASWNAQSMGAVSLDSFARVLSQKITSEDEARRIAHELVALIRQRLGS